MSRLFSHDPSPHERGRQGYGLQVIVGIRSAGSEWRACVITMASVLRLTPFQPDELSFDEQETIYVIDASNKDWWRAKVGGKVGLVPANYCT